MTRPLWLRSPSTNWALQVLTLTLLAMLLPVWLLRLPLRRLLRWGCVMTTVQS